MVVHPKEKSRASIASLATKETEVESKREVVQDEDLEDILIQIGELINFGSPLSVDLLTCRLKKSGIISAELARQITVICRMETLPLVILWTRLLALT